MPPVLHAQILATGLSRSATGSDTQCSVRGGVEVARAEAGTQVFRLFVLIQELDY